MPKRDLVRRIDLFNDGLFGSGNLTNGRTPQKYFATVVVAAYNSRPEGRAGADYVCDGVDDEATITSAITAGGSSAKRVVLLEGTYNVSGNISLVTGCTIEGQGESTLIRAATGTTILFNVDTVNQVAIKNLRITNVNFTNLAIYITGANDVTVENVTFQSVNSYSFINITGPAKRIGVRGCRFIDYTVTYACIDVFADTGDTTEQITIADNVFYGSSANDPDAIALESWDDGLGNIPAFGSIYLRNVTVTGNTFKGRAGASLISRGRFLNAIIVDSLTISGNTIDNAAYGVVLGDCPNTTISGNSFATLQTAISVTDNYYSEYNGASRYYTISGNTIRNVVYGINLNGPPVEAVYDTADIRTDEDYRAYATVTGNQIYTATEAINLINVAAVSVVGNAITGGNPTGIYIYQAWLCTVTGNTISDCTAYGMELTNAYDIHIADNMICRNAGAGIRLYGATNPSIVGNFFRDNGDSGVDDTGDITIVEPVDGTNENIYIRSNTFQERTAVDYSGGIWVTDPAAANISVEWNWGASFGIDPDVVADPDASYTYRLANNLALNVGNTIELTAALEPGNEAGTTAEAFPEDPPTPNTTLNGGILTLQGHTSFIKIPTIDGSAPYNVTSIVTDAGQNRIFIFRADSSSVNMVHGGNIHLAGGANFNFNSAYALLTMLYDGTNFLEISRSANT